MRSRWLVLGAILAATASCSWGPDGRVDGPLLTSVGSADDGMAADVQGQLELRDDCLLLGGMPVVWPEGTRWNADRHSVRLPNGDEAPVGASVTGGGGYLSPSAVRGWIGDEVADAAEPCLGGTGEIAVFNLSGEVELAE